MLRFSDHTTILPVLSISLGLAAVSLFGTSPIARADESLSFIATISSTSARATLAEPEPTVLTQNSAADSRNHPTELDDVQTQANVESYASSLIHEDERITRIELSPKRVTMSFRSQEEVAGFGMRQIERTVTVTDEGYVFVNRPWYTQDGGTTDSAESGFNDLDLVRTTEGFTPETVARILTRMHGRFAIGAL